MLRCQGQPLVVNTFTWIETCIIDPTPIIVLSGSLHKYSAMIFVLKIYGEGRHLHGGASFCLLLHQHIQKHMRCEAGDGPGKGYLCSVRSALMSLPLAALQVLFQNSI